MNATVGSGDPAWRQLLVPRSPKTACTGGAALTCGVPNGDVEGAPLLQVEGAAHGADRVREAALHVALKQRRLAHVHVPQQHDLPVRLPHGRGGGGSCAPWSPTQGARGSGPRALKDPGL